MVEKDKMEMPLMVSIRCTAYNHEPYIRQCLEGFVMQKTNFRFEAIVHDDASTDGTAAIIREYAERYPEIIKPIYETENQYSKHDGSLGKIMDEACTGKYIAICEGDDYWTDPLKLQKQVDFMEENPEYSMCFHNVDVICEEGLNLDVSMFNQLLEKDYSAEEVIKNWIVPTCSTLFTNEMLNLVPHNKNFRFGDNVLWLTCATYGKIHCINEKMGVYRRNGGGWTARSGYLIIQDKLIHYKALKSSFPNVDSNIFDIEIMGFYSSLILKNMVKFQKSSFRYFIDACKDYGMNFPVYFIMHLLKRISKQF